MTFFWNRLNAFQQAGLIFAAVGIILAGCFFAVKKVRDFGTDVSIEHSDSKANKAEDKALNDEGQADAAKAQADELEARRVEAEKQVEASRREVAAGLKLLAERKRQLDEARHNIGVDHSGSLDEREDRLLARLQTLYPDN